MVVVIEILELCASDHAPSFRELPCSIPGDVETPEKIISMAIARNCRASPPADANGFAPGRASIEPCGGQTSGNSNSEMLPERPLKIRPKSESKDIRVKLSMALNLCAANYSGDGRLAGGIPDHKAWTFKAPLVWGIWARSRRGCSGRESKRVCCPHQVA